MSGFGCNQRLWWRENPSNLLAGAETTGRVCYGLELDPKYVDVIVKRWQGFTGKKATLETCN